MANEQTDDNELSIIQVDPIQSTKEKTERIKGIRDQMNELNKGFSMMHELTMVQQPMIDQLEYNYQASEGYTQQSIGEIEKAGKYQSLGNNKKIIIFVGLLCIVLLLFIILWRKIH